MQPLIISEFTLYRFIIYAKLKIKVGATYK